MASIVTIGYLSQELAPGQLASEEVDNLLSALINNLNVNADYEILSHAIIAFLNFMVFARKNFEIPNERQILFNTIFECLKHTTVDIRVYAMQCLVEIARLYYDFLDHNIDNLIQVTEHFMRNDDMRVAIQAFEFWCSISDTELLLLKNTGTCKSFCDRALEMLFEVSKHHLTNRDAERERLEEDEWNCVKAASMLFGNLCRCTDERLIDKVFSFISENINSESPKIRDSVILAFGSVLETSHRDKIRGIIPGAIPTLLNMLNDSSSEVRCTMSWAIKKICEYHSESLASPELFDLFIMTIINNLNSSKKVVVQLCYSINFIATEMRSKVLETTGYLTNYMSTLLQTMLTIAFTKDACDFNNNVALAAFFTMGTLIDYAPMDTYDIISNFFYNNLPAAFESTLSAGNFASEEIRFAYQSYIATVISACAAGQKVKLTSDYAMSIYQLIKRSFIERQNVYEEGLMACSSLSLSLGTQFHLLIGDFITYLSWALQQWQEVNLCRISINCVSDLIRSMGDCMNNYIGQLMPTIIDILEVTYLMRFLISRTLNPTST